MFAALLVALLAPSPAEVRVWSVPDGERLQTVSAAAVEAAWFDERGRLTVSGTDVRGEVRTPKPGVDQRGMIVPGRALVTESGAQGPVTVGWLESHHEHGLRQYRMLDRAVRLRRLPREDIESLTFVPTADGLRLVVHTEEPQTLHVFGGPAWALERAVKLPSETYCAVWPGVLPFGEHALLSCGDSRVYRLDPLTGSTAIIVPDARTMTATPDGRTLVVMRDDAIHVLEADGRPRRAPIPLGSEATADERRNADLGVSPDGTRIAVSWHPGAVTVFDAVSGGVIWTRPAPSRKGSTYVDFDRSGRLLVSPEFGDADLVAVDLTVDPPTEAAMRGADGGSWPDWASMSDGRLLAQAGSGLCIIGPTGCEDHVRVAGLVSDLAAAPDRPLVASAHRDGRLLLIRLDGAPIAGEDDPHTAHPDDVIPAAGPPWAAVARRLAPMRAYLNVADGHGPWRVADGWQGGGGALLRDGISMPIVDFAAPLALLGDHLVWGGGADDDRRLRAWDLAAGRSVTMPHPHRGPVAHMARTRDGRHFATGGEDGRVVLWRAAGFEPHRTFETGRAVRDLRFSADGARLLARLDGPLDPPPSAPVAPKDGPLVHVRGEGSRTWHGPRPIRAAAPLGDTLLFGDGPTLMRVSAAGELETVHRFDDRIWGLAAADRSAYVFTGGTRAMTVVDLDTGALTRRPTPDNARFWAFDARVDVRGDVVVSGRIADSMAYDPDGVWVWPKAGPARKIELAEPEGESQPRFQHVELGPDGLLVLWVEGVRYWFTRARTTGPSSPPVRIDAPVYDPERLVTLARGRIAVATEQYVASIGRDGKAAAQRRQTVALGADGLVRGARGVIAMDDDTVQWTDDALVVQHQRPLFTGLPDADVGPEAIVPWGDAAVVIWRGGHPPRYGITIVEPPERP